MLPLCRPPTCRPILGPRRSGISIGLWLWLAGLTLVGALMPPTRVEAQVELPGAKPVPRMQVIPQPHGAASVTRDGVEVTRYHFDESLRRPFLFPLVGPSGRSVTRIGHPHDPNGHSHHNSVWVAHHDVNGVDFWGDQKAGRIVHRKVVEYGDSDAEARIRVQNDWVDPTGRRLLEEQRSMRFQPLAGGQWLLLLDIELKAVGQPATLGKTSFGLVGVRMAKTIGVHDGGGLIRNSEGGRNEAGVHWKAARWVDYSGPIRPDAAEGVTLMDHPNNPNHPTVFHVRDDGWMGTSLTFEGPRTIEVETPLRLRYAVWVHAGVPTAESIDERFAEFVSHE